MTNAQPRKLAIATRKRLSVVPSSSGWAIKDVASGKVRRACRTQKEAIAAARELVAREDGGEVVVHGRNGRIRGVDCYILGSESFDRIAAVEGIVLSEEMKRDFRALARRRLSPEKRREWLVAKYGSGDMRRGK